MKSTPRVRPSVPPPITPLTIALAVLAIISLGCGIWMYTITRDQSTQIAKLEADNAHLRENANATLYVMTPSDLAPAAMRGEVFLSTSRSGVVVLSGLPKAGSNEVYALWLINETDGTTVLAGRISTNEAGQGFALLPADSAPFNQIAVSLEATGTTVPEGDFLLKADVLPGKG